ncbi:hypothetical protein [Micromonospora haikouensis]|uniref:hypothetical protein n=1 Tax=Micromonospora haikouensis TaxID=686309 RepID=UPI0037A21056
MNLADGVAIYGALMASGVAVWQAISYRKETQPTLRIKAHAVDHLNMGTGKKSLEIHGQVTNHGRARVQLSELWLHYDVPSALLPRKERRTHGSGFSYQAGFPRWIEPGELVEFCMPEIDSTIKLWPRATPVDGDAGSLMLRVSVTVSTGQQFSQTVRVSRYSLEGVGLNDPTEPPRSHLEPDDAEPRNVAPGPTQDVEREGACLAPPRVPRQGIAEASDGQQASMPEA